MSAIEYQTAPELLAALRNLEKEISSRFGSDLDMSDELRAVMIAARTAIAKTDVSPTRRPISRAEPL